jgi:acyl transferase domain-containing protein/NAD(P)H-dependent flavin oxidoreductase YrpB (nitropropane dioxygenase family)/short-subunit dehydrogenase
MTRVSDVPGFALAVAEGGALPVLALALMNGKDVRQLARQTRDQLGELPWGIGILGFVPRELWSEQIAAALEFKPSLAVVAGGRPEQAKMLEREGIVAYLHVPAPELLRNYLDAGARRIVLEGRECGGHVGPRTSFVLWEQAVRVLLEHLRQGGAQARGEDYSVLFAGGIHDRVSAAMVSAIAAPLAERGVKIGTIVGTAYVFTREAVETGAIGERFQQEALCCKETALLESGVGYLTRCAPTPFVDYFNRQKRAMFAQGIDRDEIRNQLERLNLGRLRIAAKGIARTDMPSGVSAYERVDGETQHREGVFMLGQVAAMRDRVIGIADLHAEIGGASGFLEARILSGQRDAKPSDIAVIGVSCIFPKADGIQSYWQNILDKVNAVEEISDERFNVDLYFDPDRRARDKIYSRWGGFLDDVVFDPVRYGMPPNSVRSIEPMQLLTLDLARQALEDAGYHDRKFDRERTSVVVGTSGGGGELGVGYCFRSLMPEYLHRAGATEDDTRKLIDRISPGLPEWTEDSFAGLLGNVAAGRVANRLDLGGTNYVVDAACATSLAAVRLAMNELETRSSDLVIVAGADTNQTAFSYLCFSKTQALSPTGQCRTFDETADGIVISEGFGVAILKRLDDAIQDGDKIYAVLKSVGASSDGKDKSLTAPCPAGQVRAIDRAYRKAGIQAETVGLIEAHGTGTVVGDRSEIESLTKYFKSTGADTGMCALGSVKSMIGHTKCTAGIAGLLKAVLAVHHKVLPPMTGVTKPNSKANFSDSPFYLNMEARPWVRRLDGAPRRAGVNAFGFGGTNFHAIVEEYEAREEMLPERDAVAVWPAELFLWRGSSAEEIGQPLDQIEKAIREGARPRLCDLAAAVYWETGRREGSHCLAIVAESLDDLAAKIELARQGLANPEYRDPRGIYYSSKAAKTTGKIAFLFPGQGSQRTGMLQDLAVTFPVVRQALEEADSALGNTLGSPLSRLIYPPSSFTEEEQAAHEHALRNTRVAQPALGVADIALCRLLAELGIEADLMAGHSYGEFVALCAAGALPLSQLMLVSEARGRLIVESASPEPGTMAAIEASEEAIRASIHGVEGVTIANLNAPSQTVIAGTRAAVEESLRRLAGKGINGRSIPVACAFHSPLVEGAQKPLLEMLRQSGIQPPRIPVFSNTTAAPHAGDAAAICDLLAAHLARPVRFADELRAMHDAGARIFVEVGPGKVLSGLVSRTLENREFTAVHMDQPGRHGLAHLAHALAQLALAGVHFQGYRLYEDRVVQRLHLKSLLEETKPAALPPTSWVIRHGKAIPAAVALSSASAPLANREHKLRISTDEEESVENTPRTIAPIQTAVPTAPVAVVASARIQPQGSVDYAMQRHSEVMSRFLETQKTVMLAYLQGYSGPAETHFASATAMVPVSAQQTPTEILPAYTVQESPVATLQAIVHEPEKEEKPALITVEEILQRLIDVVAERTGYPLEMLNPDLDLEADLGIDSIKRIEVFGALQGESAGPTPQMAASDLEAELENLAKLKTLRSIAEYLIKRQNELANEQAALPAPTPQTAPKAAPVVVEHVPALTQAAQPRLRRLVVEIADAAFDGQPASLAEIGPVSITDDGAGIAALLAGKLRDLGVETEILAPSAVKSEVATPARTLIHLAPLALPPGAGADFQMRLSRELKSLFHLVRAHESGLRQNGSVLAAVRLGGAFGCTGADAEQFWPGSGAVSGFLKSLAREWSGTNARTIDFAFDAGNEFIVEKLLAELAHRDGFTEVGYRADRRETLVSAERPIEGEKKQIQLDSESVVLITGGARGITALTALEIAEQFQSTLVLAGRTPLPSEEEPADIASIADERALKLALMTRMQNAGTKPTPSAVEAELLRLRRDREIRANLAALRAAGSTVEYHPVDVADADAFGALIESIYERHGRLDGILHGAGVIEDKLIRDKSEASFDRVLSPKIAGALTLVNKVDAGTLRFLVFYSSIAGRYGSRGQSDYASANEVLNKLARQLNGQWPGRVLAINWGPWDSDAGMVSPELRGHFVKAGVQLVTPEEGPKALVKELLYGDRNDAEVILGGPAPQKIRLAKQAAGPLLSDESRVERNLNGGIEVLLEVRPEKDIYLLDHELDGVPVMPMAMALELVAEVAASHWPEMQVAAVRDVRMLNGITFPGKASRVLRVHAEAAPQASPEELLIACTIRSSRDGRDTLHYKVGVELRKHLEAAPQTPAFNLRNKQPLSITVADIYERWLFHGPLFAGIAKIHAVADDGVIAQLRTSTPEAFFAHEPDGEWITDPVLIDSALQLAVVWARTKLDQTPLPARIGRYRRFAPAAGDSILCEARIQHHPGNPILRGDILFRDETGRVIAAIDDMEGTCSSALNRLAQPHAQEEAIDSER